MADSDHVPGTRLRQMIDGFQVSQAISVAATLGIADLIAKGTKGGDELARATGAHPRSLLRLLRALATVGVFAEEDERRFALTPLAERLRTDAPDSLRTAAIQTGQPYMWAAWAHLQHSVMTGEPAFRHVHGMNAWEYRKQHPATGELFDHAMTASAKQVADSIVAAYHFADSGCVVDIGGGQGTLIAAILATCPTVRGILFDQPHVVIRAEQLLQLAGVLDRCTIVAGDFFATVPPKGDVYILKGIIHDWNDDAALSILRTCRSVMGPQSKLLLVEHVIPPGRASESGPLFIDLHMLTIHGAAERTIEDFATILGAAGFRLTRTIPTVTSLSVVEAVPV